MAGRVAGVNGKKKQIWLVVWVHVGAVGRTPRILGAEKQMRVLVRVHVGAVSRTTCILGVDGNKRRPVWYCHLYGNMRYPHTFDNGQQRGCRHGRVCHGHRDWNTQTHTLPTLTPGRKISDSLRKIHMATRTRTRTRRRPAGHVHPC